MTRDDVTNVLESFRGITPENACQKCGGWGVHAYGSTATWRDGIGGQTVTIDVCCRCWGSGQRDRHWPSHRAALRAPAGTTSTGVDAVLRLCEMEERLTAALRERDEARAALAPYERAITLTCHEVRTFRGRGAASVPDSPAVLPPDAPRDSDGH